MSMGWKIAVLGATGAVGEAILELLAERDFPVAELYLLADENSEGKIIRFAGHSHKVQNPQNFDWSLAQLAFFVAGTEASARYAEQAADAGCVVIDNSGVFALQPDIPLLIPAINPQMLAEYRNRNIIAVAGAATSQLLMAVYPLIQQVGLARLQVTNVCSASVLGRAQLAKLAGQSASLLSGIPIDLQQPEKQLAFNVLPLEKSDMLERRLIEEVRKILQDPSLPIAVSYLQAPIFYGHAQQVNFEGLTPMAAADAQQLMDLPQITLSEENDYPTPAQDIAGELTIKLGCLRNDYGIAEILQFWSVIDNIRFGGALMAVETAELWAKDDFW